jgi:hypothetical protein
VSSSAEPGKRPPDAAFRVQIIVLLVAGILLPPLGLVALLRMRRRPEPRPSTTGWTIARYAAGLEILITAIVILRLLDAAMGAALG